MKRIHDRMICKSSTFPGDSSRGCVEVLLFKQSAKYIVANRWEGEDANTQQEAVYSSIEAAMEEFGIRVVDNERYGGEDK